MGWIIWGSHPVRGCDFSAPNHPDWLWDPHSFVVSTFPGVKQLGVMLTTCLHLVLRLRRSRAIHLLPPYAFMAWTGAALLFFFQNNKSYYYISNFMCILSRHQVCDWHIKNIWHFSQLDKMYQLLQKLCHYDWDNMSIHKESK